MTGFLLYHSMMVVTGRRPQNGQPVWACNHRDVPRGSPHAGTVRIFYTLFSDFQRNVSFLLADQFSEEIIESPFP